MKAFSAIIAIVVIMFGLEFDASANPPQRTTVIVNNNGGGSQVGGRIGGRNAVIVNNNVGGIGYVGLARNNLIVVNNGVGYGSVGVSAGCGVAGTIGTTSYSSTTVSSTYGGVAPAFVTDQFGNVFRIR